MKQPLFKTQQMTPFDRLQEELKELKQENKKVKEINDQLTSRLDHGHKEAKKEQRKEDHVLIDT